MVVDEDAESVNIAEVALFLAESVFDIIHGLCAAKNIFDCVVHWVVEEACHVFLVWTNIGWISIEALSHLEHTSSLPVFAPEILSYLWDGIDSDSIEAKIFDEL